MNSFFFSFVVLTFCSLALAADDNDQKCKNEFQSFLSCSKQQRDQQSQSDKDAAKKERQGKVDKCFAQANCDGPNWNSESGPNGGKQRGFSQAQNQIPEAVKQCMKKKMIEKIGAKMNECLAKKGVKKVNFTELAEHNGEDGFGGSTHGDKGGMHASISARFQVIKAVDQCCQKKGGDTNSVKPLEQCLHNVKRDERKEQCTKAKPCMAKVRPPCKKRLQEVHKALCQCKKDKETESAKKLRELAAKQPKVSMGEIMNVMAGDQAMQGMMQEMDNCYQETGTPANPLIKFFQSLIGSKGVFGGNGSGKSRFGAQFDLEARTVIIMSDMMDIDAQDQSDCEACK